MYRLFKGRTAAKAATGALVGLALCSCASHYVAPDADDTHRASFATATEYASGKAKELHEKLVELDDYDRVTGAVILGSSVAAIALGAYGAHADALLGASEQTGGRALLMALGPQESMDRASATLGLLGDQVERAFAGAMGSLDVEAKSRWGRDFRTLVELDSSVSESKGRGWNWGNVLEFVWRER